MAGYSGEESIYNIIARQAPVQPKPKMFKSKISGDVVPTATTFHLPGTSHPIVSNMAGNAVGAVVKPRSHAEFGKPCGTNKNDPKHPMKKMAKSFSVPSLAEVKKTSPDQLKPKHLKESRYANMPGGGRPPPRDDVPVMNLVTSKNFIVANAVEAILAAPKRIPDNTKDYLHKEDFGRVPKYLTQVKKDIEAEYDYIRQLQEEQFQESQVHRPLEEEERLDVIEGLKAKWEAVNTAYQAETHISILESGQKYRKEKREAELAQLEKDIERLNKKNITVDAAR